MEHNIDKILCNPAQANMVRTMLEKRGAYQSVGIITADEKVNVGEILLFDAKKKVYLHLKLG